MGSIISPAIKALIQGKDEFNAIAQANAEANKQLAHKRLVYAEEAEFARQLIKDSVPGDINNPRDQANARYCLYQCTQESIKNAIVGVAALGLTLNPTLNQAYLIPRWNKKKRLLECRLEPGYQGMINLATECGMIQFCAAEQVFEEDIEKGTFIYQGALKPPIHTGNPFSTSRGKCVGVYCVAVLDNDHYITTVMNRQELDAAANLSHTNVRYLWQGEMDKKSVIRRAYKIWPKPRNNIRVNSLTQLMNHGQIKNILRVLPRDDVPKSLPRKHSASP